MDFAKCETKEVVLTHQNGSTETRLLRVTSVQTTSTQDGFCSVQKMKVGICGRCGKDEPIDLSAVKKVTCYDKTWEVYRHSPGNNKCWWAQVLRVRCYSIPCSEEIKVCQCEKDDTCDGGFYAVEKFIDEGRIRKMRMRESRSEGMLRNQWDYRYYSNNLKAICELKDLKRILIKITEGENAGEYVIGSADFSGDCPFAIVTKQKGTTEIREE